MPSRRLYVAAFVAVLVACGGDDGGGTADDGGNGGGDGGAGGDGGVAAETCKRGLGYGYHSQADLEAISAGVSWWYNWASLPDEDVRESYGTTGVAYVPMVWGEASLAGAGGDVRADARYLLAFNEPNFGSQANLTTAQAAALWPQVEAIARAHDLEIVSPAVNYCGGNCNQTDPFLWLEGFFAACPDCQVDAIAVHWYACTGDALRWYIGEMKRFGKPIWLTEFACLDGADRSVAAQQAYLAEALAYLESEPAVERYAWFSGRFAPAPTVNLFAAGSGELTALGRQYVDAPRSCP